MARKAIAAMQDRDVEVIRLDLLETLRENRLKHIKNYREAVKGYKAAAQARLTLDGGKAVGKLTANLEEVRKSIDKFDPSQPHEFSDCFVLVRQIVMTLPVSRSYEEQYDAAIAIAEWEVNDVMKLSFHEFNCFVRDKWDWTDEFIAVSSSCTAG